MALNSTLRSTCRACGSSGLNLVLDFGDMPLAGGFVVAEDPRLQQRFPLRLVHCEDCTLMQVADTIGPEMIFSEYSYVSSVNRTLVRHFEEVAGEIFDIAGREGLVVEFGCNDGVLLNPLAALGTTVVGVDPSDVARRASAENGWPLCRTYFGPEIAKKVRAESGPAKVVTANNVCAHVDDPNVLIEGVAEILAEDGCFIFEVHYQGDLIKQTQYDTVYHEHTCYYSLRSLDRLLSNHGLMIADVRRIPIHSGSIHVTAVRATPDVVVSDSVAAMLAAEAGWDIAGFADRARALRTTLRNLITDLVAGGKRIVAYGASGRATILLNFCELGPDLVEHVSDLSPLRYGRLVPGVRVPILPRATFHEDPPDYAILTAWNYEAEITENERLFLEGGGSFIIPLPDIRLV